MSELNIKDADVLVNCSITKRSKTNFFFRYSTILTNCLSYDAESQVRWVANAFKSIEVKVQEIEKFLFLVSGTEEIREIKCHTFG